MTVTSIFEQLGGTYTEGSNGMLYPNLTLGDREHPLSAGGDACTEPILKQNILACMNG